MAERKKSPARRRARGATRGGTVGSAGSAGSHAASSDAATPAVSPHTFELLGVAESQRPGWYIVRWKMDGRELRTNVSPIIFRQKLRTPNLSLRAQYQWLLDQCPA